jgi:hypothetical protein
MTAICVLPPPRRGARPSAAAAGVDEGPRKGRHVHASAQPHACTWPRPEHTAGMKATASAARRHTTSRGNHRALRRRRRAGGIAMFGTSRGGDGSLIHNLTAASGKTRRARLDRIERGFQDCRCRGSVRHLMSSLSSIQGVANATITSPIRAFNRRATQATQRSLSGSTGGCSCLHRGRRSAPRRRPACFGKRPRALETSGRHVPVCPGRRRMSMPARGRPISASTNTRIRRSRLLAPCQLTHLGRPGREWRPPQRGVAKVASAAPSSRPTLWGHHAKPGALGGQR